MLEQCPYTAGMAGRPPTKPAPPFGAQLAALRQMRGWNQQEMARVLEISPQMLAYYERRAKNPSADILAKIASLFDLSTDQLLGRPKSKRKSGPPSEFERRLQAIHKLPKSRQRLLLELVDTFLREAEK